MPRTSVAAGKQLATRAFDLGFDAFRAEMEARFRACLESEHRAAMAETRARRRRPKP
ncbi:MAG: hypothetical protein HY217_07010 [Candidatus Rokubacteria bacterium]|nr:hypothetical protein [Candidatus Rokubacteria bacterium]